MSAPPTGVSAAAPIPALQPRTPDGAQFVCYADSCSGVPGAPHATTLAAVNQTLRRLQPAPEFICFPGDEIIGLTDDPDALRAQWTHWFEVEMGWRDPSLPIYHTTGNHTAYDPMSAAVYAAIMAHLPHDGPPGPRGLNYTVCRGDLSLIFLDTLSPAHGGEGRVDVAWLARALAAHASAPASTPASAHRSRRRIMVFGHHPVFPVNGFHGAYQRHLDDDDARDVWALFVRYGVLAYWCSHILAFDVQVHDGVLQICTAGAGTAHRMPEGIEYLHLVQAAVDAEGLRYQVLDTAGTRREWLSWPPRAPSAEAWRPVGHAPLAAPAGDAAMLTVWRITAETAADSDGTPQTLLCGWPEAEPMTPFWLGLAGPEQRLTLLLQPAPGRSPHVWLGPAFGRQQPLQIEVALHDGMGPGGCLWRPAGTSRWHTLRGSAAWGVERLAWPTRWQTGRDRHDTRPFRGRELYVTVAQAMQPR